MKGLNGVAISAVAALAVGCGGINPHWLARSTAASAIESSARFQHSTTLSFEVGQFSGIVLGVCHNFAFSPSQEAHFERLKQSGALQFVAFGNQTEPYPVASEGTYQLSDSGVLTDNVDRCQPKEVTPFVGRYELTPGHANVVVTGIRKSGSTAHVEFLFYFSRLDPMVERLGEVEARKRDEVADTHTTHFEKSLAPYWGGAADFVNYDDGWRMTFLKLNWDLGPEWPDPELKWSAADEDENDWARW